MRKCYNCKTEKELVDFENSKKGLDGKSNRCKECKNKASRERYKKNMSNPLNKELERQRGREKYYRLGQKYKYNAEAQKTWRRKYPEKLQGSIDSRNLPRKKGSHLHHWSYNKDHTKDVIELTIKEHNLVHRYLKYDKESFMYKTLDNILLDTRELHLKYINSVIEHDRLLQYI